MMSANFKVVLLGEGRVGKTSLVVRYMKNEFTETHPPTIQAAFLSKRIIVDGHRVTLNIWDTAGQERFHALGPIYYRDADAALLVFDITDTESFDRVKSWVKELKTTAGRDIVLTIAANKLDLESNRQVLKETVLQYASTIGAPVFSTSAKTNKGIEQCFIEIARQILKRQISQNRSTHRNGGDKTNRQVRSSLTISAEPPPSDPQKSSCC